MRARLWALSVALFAILVHVSTKAPPRIDAPRRKIGVTSRRTSLRGALSIYQRRPIRLRVGREGFLEPEPRAAWIVEDALEEANLYREIADLAEASDERIVRVASRYGLLGRAASLAAASATPALASWASAERDRLAEAARAEAGAPDRVGNPATRADARLVDALAASLEGVVMGPLLDELRRSFEVDDADLDQLTAVIRDAPTDMTVPELVQRLRHAAQPIARRHRRSGRIPPWVDLLDAPAAEVDAALGNLNPALDAIAVAWRRDDLGEAGQKIADVANLVGRVKGSRSDQSSLPDLLAPLLQLAGNAAPGPSGGPRRAARPSRGFFRLVVAQLLAWWGAQDAPGATGASLALPRLGDPATWRMIFLMIPARPAVSRDAASLFDPGRQDRTDDWRALARECALWRNVADLLTPRTLASTNARAESRQRLLDALARLDADLAARFGQVPASADAARSFRQTRARLLRLLAWRRAIAGVEPEPVEGLLGTEARTLISIGRAIAADGGERTCAWPEGCRTPLPPGSHRNRKYCEAHRKVAPRLRVRRARSAAN